MKKIKVLSLFDGISCGQVALKSLGYDVEYYASEIDKYAIEIANKNYPDTKQLGDIKNVNFKKYGLVYDNKVYYGDIDLLIGGSPCQDLSIAKKNRKGLKGKRSGLFYEYLRILKEVKPKYFVLENVASMPKEAKDEISKELGVEPIMINAALVSAQQRKRLFWTNIPNIVLPEDRKIYLKDILEAGGYTEKEKSYCIDAHYYKGTSFKNYVEKSKRQLIFNKPVRVGKIGKGGQGGRVYSIGGKSVSLSANGGGWGAKTGLYHIPHGYIKEKISQVDKYPTLCAQNPASKHLLIFKDYVRKLTPIECERLQSLDDNFTEGLSNTQRYRSLGNAFNVEVVKHILSYIK